MTKAAFIGLVVSLGIVVLNSCNGESEISANEDINEFGDDDITALNGEVPEWLQTSITKFDSSLIGDTDTSSYLNYGAWIRYELDGELLYIYENPLSSYAGCPQSFVGKEIDCSHEKYSGYWERWCCKKYLWKGLNYSETGNPGFNNQRSFEN